MKKTIILLLALAGVCIGCTDKPTLYVYSWSDYFSPELIQKFEKQHDCKVVIDSFDSNEAMYAKIKAGGMSYDILTPSSYQIAQLAADDLILELDHSKLTIVLSNFNHSLDKQIQDPNLRWSVPYACTYAGLMYDKSKVDSDMTWEIYGSDQLCSKMTMLDDMRETIGIGLMHNGYSLNSTNKQEIYDAAQTICKWKKNIRKFDSESYKIEVADGSTIVGHGYASDALQIIVDDNRNDIGFALPTSGFTIAWDEFVISKNSTKIGLAYEFINFFFDDDNAYDTMLYIYALMANKPAIQRLDQQIRDLLMPTNINCGQVIKGFSDQNVLEYYNDAWNKIKSIK